MKKGLNFLLILFIGLLALSCDKKQESSNTASDAIYDNTPEAPGTQPEAPKQNTKMEFEESEFNFGTIDQGAMVTHVFKFRNTGEHPLVISDARADCGCTVPNWPKEPIMPGKESQIEVKFNSAGKQGDVSKTVTILANTDPSDTKIHINGKVRVNNASPMKK